MNLTTLEKAIVASISVKKPRLSTLLQEAQVGRREYTGAGFYVELRGGVSRDDWDRPPVDGPHIKSPALPHGGGSLLWLVGGEPACLELFSYGDVFPERIDVFELS